MRLVAQLQCMIWGQGLPCQPTTLYCPVVQVLSHQAMGSEAVSLTAACIHFAGLPVALLAALGPALWPMDLTQS